MAAELLRSGAVVGMPTETVYGLAANACDEEAVGRIFTAKGRPQDNPLIVHISKPDAIDEISKNISNDARKLAEAFWPGPLTMVLPDNGVAAKNVTAGLGTIGVRLPANPVARALIEQAGVPLAAPSANLSGSPSPTSAQHVLADMRGRIPAVIDGGQCVVGLESTVVSLVGAPIILRPGFVTREGMEAVLGRPVALSPHLENELPEGERAHSPGMKYKHYAPKAEITILLANDSDYYAYVNNHGGENVFALCFSEDIPHLTIPHVSLGSRHAPEEQAAGLFSVLRLLDQRGAKTVYARMPMNNGVGLAVRNRLLRAAAFRVVDLAGK